MPKLVFLWTDVFVYLLTAGVLLYAWRVSSSPSLRLAWKSVSRTPSAMCAAVVITCFALIGLLDSIHYRPLLPPMAAIASVNPGQATEGGSAQDGVSSPAQEAAKPAQAASETLAGAPTPVYSPVMRSVLDDVLSLSKLASREKTYSAPLAIRQFTKETEIINGLPVRDYPRLKYAGQGVDDGAAHDRDLRVRLLRGLVYGVAAALAAAALMTLRYWRPGRGFAAAWSVWWRGETGTPWRPMWITFSILSVLVAIALTLSVNYHVLGTDRTGNDVLWMSLKSVRTALVIGTLTTLAMLPPALIFGIAAGYFKGRVDDVIQYIYTTLTSIPGILLIAACVLMMQVYIDNNPNMFDTVASRADLRLFLLCMILGLTGWSGLCRLLRAETLKLRELEYIQAAQAFGVGHWRIMTRHLLPNLMHIVLITLVLEFSGLVLYEAVLSYLGIGVDPSTPSFGTMIDMARVEMSRDPMIWWNLLGAFTFLLALVLAANLFADAVQSAFDPRMRRFRPIPPALVGGRAKRKSRIALKDTAP